MIAVIDITVNITIKTSLSAVAASININIITIMPIVRAKFGPIASSGWEKPFGAKSRGDGLCVELVCRRCRLVKGFVVNECRRNSLVRAFDVYEILNECRPFSRVSAIIGNEP